jgi:hypothetical protein
VILRPSRLMKSGLPRRPATGHRQDPGAPVALSGKAMESLSPDRPMRSRRRHLAALCVALLAVAGLAGAGPASAATAAAESPPCPTGVFAFTSTFTNGAFKIGRHASASGVKGAACGSLVSLNGGLGSVVSKDNVSFEPTTTKVLFLNLPTTVTPTSDLTGPVALTAAGIEVSLAGTVKVTTKILGSRCSFPLNLKLTTGTSGALSGTPLVADATTPGVFKGKLVAGDFTVPKLKPTKTCSALVAGFANGLLGLPLAAGKSTVGFDLALHLGVNP